MSTQFYNLTRGETFRLYETGFSLYMPPKAEFAKASWEQDELIFAISNRGQLIALSHLANTQLANTQLSQEKSKSILEKIKETKWKSALLLDY